MLKVDQVHECKRLFGQGCSLREIARRLEISRNTVRRYVRDGKLPGSYEKQKRREAPVRDRIEPIVRELLEKEVELQTPRKQRLTGSQLRRILAKNHGIVCSETSVRRVVRTIRQAQRDPLEQAFLKLDYEPGRDAQVDFFEADVLEPVGSLQPDGEKVRRHFLVVRMCFSRKLFVYAAPNQTREALLEGLMQAFEYFGGVPQVLWFDNMTSAVKKVLRGRDRELQRGFEVFQAYYGFQSEFCRPGRGNEKGGVENGVKHAQRAGLSPMPKVRSREELQALCREFSKEDAERVPRHASETIEQAFKLDHAGLMQLPPDRFDPSQVVTRRVTKHAWIQHGTNFYSVPVDLVGQEVHVRLDAERVRIFADDLVAEHRREHGHHQMVLDIEHYLPLLERKVRALPHAVVVRRFIEQAGSCWRVLLRLLQDRQGPYQGGVDFVSAIRLCTKHGRERVTAAVERALQHDEVSLATVRYQLGADRERAATRAPALDYPSPVIRAAVANDYNEMLGARHV